MNTILISIIIAQFIIIGGLGYAVYNLLRKLDFWEKKYKLTLIITDRMVKNMKEIDSMGAFESDDEVGTTINELKTLVNEYRKDIE